MVTKAHVYKQLAQSLVTWWWNGRELNLWPLDRKPDAITITPPSHLCGWNNKVSGTPIVFACCAADADNQSVNDGWGDRGKQVSSAASAIQSAVFQPALSVVFGPSQQEARLSRLTCIILIKWLGVIWSKHISKTETKTMKLSYIDDTLFAIFLVQYCTNNACFLNMPWNMLRSCNSSVSLKHI